MGIDALKNENIDPVQFYQKLDKKDKAKFLRHLNAKYEYSASTMMQKLSVKSSRTRLRKDEELVLRIEIESGEWRKA